jgi:ABC-2 type transport system ATP-binding protein
MPNNAGDARDVGAAAVVEVEALSKRYGAAVAVADVSFKVAEGEIFGILGPNGAGKTTIVECVQGLRLPDAGRVKILGLDPHRDRAELRRRVGSQLQESALPDRLKVWEAVDLFASLSPGGSDWHSLLEQWGLAGHARAPFASLSGGQRQRLFVALALVNDPKVVFLDEMTQGLDPAGRRVAWDLIRAIRERGTTVVLVTHYMDEAEQVCDRLAVINRGRIVALGTPQALVARSGKEVRLRFSAGEQDVSWLEEVAHVTRVRRQGAQIEVAGHGPVLVLVAAALVAHNLLPVDVRVEQPSLEDVYLDLTGGSA